MDKYLNVDEVIEMYGDDKHLLVVGKTGSGKTTFVKNYLERINDKRVFQVVGDEDLTELVNTLNFRMNERIKILKDAEVNNLEELIKKTGLIFKKEFLVIDGIEMCIEKLSQNKEFDEILKMGRALGFHILATCQSDVYLRGYGKTINNFIKLNA